MIAEKYLNLLDKLEMYVFSYADNISHFNLNPFDRTIKKENIFDCTKTNSEEFYKLLRQMDAITFGDQGMAMEGWMYFDCSAMPGSIVGFGINVQELPSSLREKLDIPADYKSIVPVSMYIAIPMIGGKWFGHNLSSLKSILGHEFSGLGLLTKAIGISVLNINELYGATQWSSKAVHIHTQLSDMELISSITPVHTHRYSLCYRSVHNESSLKRALNGTASKAHSNPDYEQLTILEDESLKQEEIQYSIEKGDKYIISGRPLIELGKLKYTLLKKTL